MIRIDRYKCGYCGACVAVCPADAISLVSVWISLDEDKCTSCGVCAEICPVGALEIFEQR